MTRRTSRTDNEEKTVDETSAENEGLKDNGELDISHNPTVPIGDDVKTIDLETPEVAVYEDKDARARGNEDVDVIDGPAPEGVPAANKSLAEVFEEGRQVGAYGHAWGTYGPNPYA